MFNLRKMRSMDDPEPIAPAIETPDGPLAVVKHGGETGAESKLQCIQDYSRSSIEVSFAVLDDDRTNERDTMVQLNRQLAEISGKLHLIESETVFIEIISNVKDFAKLFENLIIGERTEMKRLRRKVRTIETEKSTLSENLAVEKLKTEDLTRTIEQLKQIAEKTNKEMYLLREENRNLQVEYTKLKERWQAEERRVMIMVEELEYLRKTVDAKDQEIKKILGGVSGLSVLVSWETKMKSAIVDIRKQYEEQLKKIQASYEQRMDIEISEIRMKIKKMLDAKQDGYLKEIEDYRQEISYLKEQIEAKDRYIEAMANDYRNYKKWCEDKLRELQADLGRVDICIRRYNKKDFSLKSEIDNYRHSLDEMEKRIVGIKGFFATVKIKTEGTAQYSPSITEYIPSTDGKDPRVPGREILDGPVMPQVKMDGERSDEDLDVI